MINIYIFYDASVNNPPLCLHVYRCVSILCDRCPEMFIFFNHLLALRSCVSSVDFIKKDLILSIIIIIITNIIIPINLLLLLQLLYFY